MNFPLTEIIVFGFIFVLVLVKSEEDFGLRHYRFDDDILTEQCTKPQPIIYKLMLDFMKMIQAESLNTTQRCVLNGEGPGFSSTFMAIRGYFALTTIAYNTYARYDKRANPVHKYNGWTRIKPQKQSVPDCVYVYGFYHIANYLLPERVAEYQFKNKYETVFNCDLTKVSPAADSELGLVQKDVDYLISQLETDGFNQQGCYSDMSNYRPINPPCILDNRTTVEACRNYTHKYNTTLNYASFAKSGFVNAPRPTDFSFAQACRPFALERLFDYMAPPLDKAAAYENGTIVDLRTQFLDLITLQKELADSNSKGRLIVEFWAGARTTEPWDAIFMNIARRMCYDNDDTIKFFFSVGAAMYDGLLTSGHIKRFYNSARPVTFIPTEFIDEDFENQFVGMYCDFMNIKGWQWTPYQLERVLTPSMPEYTSGHSTVSRAVTYILEKFTGSPYVPGNLSITVKAGESYYQPRCAQTNSSCYRKCRFNASQDSENNYSPKIDVQLGPWKTYSEMAYEAGLSRRLGGIHIQISDTQGQRTGRIISELVWAKVTSLFNGRDE